MNEIGKGECSAGILDLIEFDQFTEGAEMQVRREESDSEPGRNLSREIGQEKGGSPSPLMKDLRGVACPLNFAKVKIELSGMKEGELLEVRMHA